MFVVRLSNDTPVGTWVSQHNGSQVVPGKPHFVLVPGTTAPTGDDVLRTGPVQILPSGNKSFSTDEVMVKAEQKRTAVWIRNAFPGHNSVVSATPLFKAGGPGITAKSWVVTLAPRLDPETVAAEVSGSKGVVRAEPNQTNMGRHHQLPHYHH